MLQRPDPRTLALLFASLYLGACGLKGPLYLPDSARDEAIAAPAAGTVEPETTPTPTQQRERATDKAPASDTQTPVSPPDPDRPASSEPEPQNP